MSLDDKIELYEKVKSILVRRMHDSINKGDYVSFLHYNTRYVHIDKKLDELYNSRKDCCGGLK